MKIKIIRPFYLATHFWKYKVEINGNPFVINKSDDTFIELEECQSINIKVNYNNYFTSELTIDNASKCKGIEIKCRVSNLTVVTSLLIMLAAFITTLYTGNNLFLYGAILLYSLLGLLFYDLLRKRFFKIICVE